MHFCRHHHPTKQPSHKKDPTKIWSFCARHHRRQDFWSMLRSFCHKKIPRRQDKELTPRPSRAKAESLSIRPQNAVAELPRLLFGCAFRACFLTAKKLPPKSSNFPNFIEIWSFWSRRQKASNFIEILSFCDSHQKAPSVIEIWSFCDRHQKATATRKAPNFIET